ncbi:MAG TPA: RDD family protein, partial [Luteolibacter sp.]
PAEPARQSPPPLPVKPRCFRRFCARWLDLTLYSGFWWIGMWAAGQDIEAVLLHPWMMFFHYVPWFFLEPLLIHRFGSTPGKWLLGLEVVNQDGSRLSLAAATRRSLQVMISGIGFGWYLLAIFCQVLSLITTQRLGTTFWDHAGGHRVTAAPLNPLRISAFVSLFAGSLILHFIIFSPYIYEMSA